MAHRENFPQNPIDGQIYTDSYGVDWRYDTQENDWTQIGMRLDYPVAKLGNDCLEDDQ